MAMIAKTILSLKTKFANEEISGKCTAICKNMFCHLDDESYNLVLYSKDTNIFLIYPCCDRKKQLILLIGTSDI